jgi:hypothetical protein
MKFLVLSGKEHEKFSPEKTHKCAVYSLSNKTWRLVNGGDTFNYVVGTITALQGVGNNVILVGINYPEIPATIYITACILICLKKKVSKN